MEAGAPVDSRAPSRPRYVAGVILEPLPLSPEHGLPGELLTELTALYASNREFHALSGDFPDPDDIRPEQVAAALADELAHPGVQVLLARSFGRLVGMAITLAHHPDPADPELLAYGREVDANAPRTRGASGR